MLRTADFLIRTELKIVFIVFYFFQRAPKKWQFIDKWKIAKSWSNTIFSSFAFFFLVIFFPAGFFSIFFSFFLGFFLGFPCCFSLFFFLFFSQFSFSVFSPLGYFAHFFACFFLSYNVRKLFWAALSFWALNLTLPTFFIH